MISFDMFWVERLTLYTVVVDGFASVNVLVPSIVLL